MILLASEIQRQMDVENIVIEPFDPEMMNPNSVDVRLGNTLMSYIVGPRLDAANELDPKKDNPTVEVSLLPTGYVLQPGKLYLAKTLEYTETHAHVPMLDGKSSIGRLGLSVHVTAGRGDIGFCGNWTLELTATQPVRVYPGMRIGQIWYLETKGEISKTYEGRYQGQRGPTPCRLHLDGVRDVQE